MTSTPINPIKLFLQFVIIFIFLAQLAELDVCKLGVPINMVGDTKLRGGGGGRAGPEVEPINLMIK